jgi:hypothetical protein
VSGTRSGLDSAFPLGPGYGYCRFHCWLLPPLQSQVST